ncbi:hypothetical protein ACFWA5_47290 [Streptomyces mirabilis]|uniref:hypothetical protein n=1 Tax=Streptomyces mirabilis TaxID=68239 RepID=UPI0036630898
MDGFAARESGHPFQLGQSALAQPHGSVPVGVVGLVPGRLRREQFAHQHEGPSSVDHQKPCSVTNRFSRYQSVTGPTVLVRTVAAPR